MIIYSETEKKERTPSSPPIGLIFYQPLLKDKMNWEKIFQKLQKAQIDTLILQWSKYGVVDFMKTKIWLNNILFLAQKHHIKVIVGLYGDESYFKTLENRQSDVQKYLQALYTKNIIQAKKIYNIAKHHKSFAGYYIYDEIDDTNFIGKERQRYLTKYLEKIAKSIENISSHPLYISGYFSKHMSPLAYTKMFNEITQKKYTVLLQSGIGAELVDEQESRLYMKVFQQNFKGNFQIIVEGFKFQHNKIEAIDFKKLQKQITSLKLYGKNSNLCLFSLRYFLDPKLFNAYLLKYENKS